MRVLWAAAVAVMLAACSDDSAAPVDPRGNISGAWAGSFQLNGETVGVEMTLTHTAGPDDTNAETHNVQGTARLSGALNETRDVSGNYDACRVRPSCLAVAGSGPLVELYIHGRPIILYVRHVGAAEMRGDVFDYGRTVMTPAAAVFARR